MLKPRWRFRSYLGMGCPVYPLPSTKYTKKTPSTDGTWEFKINPFSFSLAFYFLLLLHLLASCGEDLSLPSGSSYPLICLGIQGLEHCGFFYPPPSPALYFLLFSLKCRIFFPMGPPPRPPSDVLIPSFNPLLVQIISALD